MPPPVTKYVIGSHDQATSLRAGLLEEIKLPRWGWGSSPCTRCTTCCPAGKGTPWSKWSGRGLSRDGSEDTVLWENCTLGKIKYYILSMDFKHYPNMVDRFYMRAQTTAKSSQVSGTQSRGQICRIYNRGISSNSSYAWVLQGEHHKDIHWFITSQRLFANRQTMCGKASDKAHNKGIVEKCLLVEMTEGKSSRVCA